MQTSQPNFGSRESETNQEITNQEVNPEKSSDVLALNQNDDEALRQAIELSLQPDCSPANQDVIDLVSDASTTDDEASIRSPSLKSHSTEASVLAPAAPNPVMLGLDRKAMEQERLARKRKPSISPPPFRRNPNLSRTKAETPESVSHVKSLPQAVRPSQTSNLPFANGAVKKTWAFGHARQDDIKLEEVLQKNDLDLAVLSSFQWDVDWVLRKIDTTSTQMVFVMQANHDEIKARYRRQTAAMSNLRLCFPSMDGQINCMHSKLMLLSYPTHLRIVVPTANLTPYDWGETGIMENTVFLIDLPRLSIEKRSSAVAEMTDFDKDLTYFLQAKGLDKTIIDSLRHFDFSATKDLAFVHTIGGAHVGADEPWRRTGSCGLGRAVSRLGLASDKILKINYVTSSVGALNIDFLTMLYLACQGDDGMTDYKWRTEQSKKKTKAPENDLLAVEKHNAQKKASDGFRVYFPSLDTVKASRGGPNNGGTICFTSKWWESPTFPQELLRDCKSRREGLLMHNKV